MKNDQFFRMKASLMADDEIICMIEKGGIKAFGIYMSLLLELRTRDNYTISYRSLPALARRWNVAPEEVEDVVNGYKLFEIQEQDGEELRFSSPYMDEVMAKLEEKRRSKVAAGNARAATGKRNDRGQFTSNDQPEEKSREEKSRVTEKNGGGGDDDKNNNNRGGGSTALRPVVGWETCIDRAFGEQSWVELQAMHSGMGRAFMQQLEPIRQFFKQHVKTYGKESSILSETEAKSYFSNFIQRGALTRRRLDTFLEKQQSKQQETNPYRYEQRDPKTGERSYCGMPIPKKAPPRPNDNAIWDGRHWS